VPHAKPSGSRFPPSYRRAAILLILAVAVFFRLFRLDAVPPGLTHDEADTGYFVAAVHRGAPSRIDIPYGYAYKPFTQYSGALFMALFGPTDLALRLHSAFFGTLLVLFTYLWCREAFGTAVGLGSAAMVAVSFWTVCDSRFALNSAPAPALFTGSAYFLWLALNRDVGRPLWWAWGLFALLLGGSLYVYEAALAAALSLILLLLYLALTDAKLFRRQGPWFGGALILATLLAAPHLLDSSSWGRTNTLSGPLLAASRGELGPLFRNAVSALGTFSFRGDTLVTYNLPGRPIFDPVTSLFFYGGLALSLWRWRTPAYAFLVMWLMTGIVPSLVIGEWTSTLHSKAAETAIMTLPVVGAVAAGRAIRVHLGRNWFRLFAGACIVWLVVIAGLTGYDYFVRWGQAPETRAAYFSNLAAITDYLNEIDYSGPVSLSSPFPDLPHDPLVAQMRLHREDLSLSWFDARRALVFPQADHALLIIPPNTPLADPFAGRLGLRLVERVELKPDDIDPYFDVFEWPPNTALSELLTPASGIAHAGGESLELPVSLGGGVELVGYEVAEQRLAPGETIDLITFWRVKVGAGSSSSHPLGNVPEDAFGHSLTLFTHLVDDGNHVVAQEDRLDAPAWNWHGGETVAQIHRLQIGPDVEPGVYHLQVGIYDNHDPELARLPIVVDGEVVGDSVRLQPLEVTDS